MESKKSMDQEPAPEQPSVHELAEKLYNHLEQDDIDFLKGDVEGQEELDFDSALNYVYGRLLELGEDPDVVLLEAGITT